MEEEVDVRLVEIIYFDVVDCQLLFLVTQLLPLALRLGDVLLGKLRDAVVFVPEQLELLVDSFLFLFPGIGQSHPFVIFDDAYVQGCIVGVGDDFDELDELQKKNTVLLRKYNGDAKFARVHKRIREENLARKAANKQPIVSEYDMSIMNVLLSIKSDIDQKVYDRNDILKKDAYFERTVMTQIKAGIDKLGIASAREDRVFIQSRITKQYLDQYNQTYSVA